ncbi:MAG: tetratricopeptide repeat protein [Candidatus Hodarchaeota archaeon]
MAEERENAEKLQSILKEGIDLLKRRKIDDAMELLDKVLEADPLNVEALYQKGFALNLIAKPEEALEHLEAALELDPENIPLLIETGHTMNDLEKYDEGLTLLEKVLTLLSPNGDELDAFIDALDGKAYALSNLGRHTSAIETLEYLLDLDPGNVKAQKFFKTLVDIIGIDVLDEVVYLGTKCLKKAIYHALVFSKRDDFSMAYGILGGKNQEDGVHVLNSFAMGHGTSDKVEFDEGERYIALAEFDDELSQDGNFAVGWYASIMPKGTFLCTINANNHANGYQKLNPKAIAVSIRPKIIWDADLEETIGIYRLGNPMFSEKREKPSWLRLQFELIDVDNDSFLDQIRQDYIEFFKQIDQDNLDDHVLNSMLDEWIEK